MMAVTFNYQTDLGLHQRRVAPADVAAAEQYLGLSLPPEFRDFLVTHDGPTPSPGWFPAAGPTGPAWCGPIHSFLSTYQPLGRGGIGRSPCLEHFTQTCREWEKLPAGYVAIAQMMTHPSTLLISTAGADRGAVYAWRVGTKRFRPDQLVRAAGSFPEFLGLLAEPPADVAARFGQAVRDHAAGVPERRPAEDQYDGPEARKWLRRNGNPAALAANHFDSTDAARRFVEELYAAGARRVLIAGDSIQDEDDGGPYADAIVVLLPTDAAARAAVCRRCERELDEPETIDADDPNPIFLWWD
jgi:hypothetical protein